MKNIDFQNVFREIEAELKTIDDGGAVASYIPELGNVDPGKLGIHLVTIHGEHHFSVIRVKNSLSRASQKSCP